MESSLAAPVVRGPEPPTASTPTPRQWIPGLDGLRAISVALVLLAHLGPTRFAPDVSWNPFTRATGVCLFFLISGYLITTLLLDEEDRMGEISLARFYARRSLRIFPAAYAMLAVLIVLRHAGVVQFTNMGFFASATYWRNLYHHGRGGDWVLDHTWSLSLEEQFYLVWPLFVQRLSRRRCTWLATALIVGWPLLRLLRHGTLADGGGRAALDICGMDTVLVGCLLALLSRGPAAVSVRALMRNRLVLPAVTLALVVLYRYADPCPPAWTALLPALRNVLLAYLLAAVVFGEASRPVIRALDWKPLSFIGQMSYSIYLWQQLFLDPDRTSWWCAFPQNIGFVFSAAAISYFVLERPLNAVRRRFAVRPPKLALA